MRKFLMALMMAVALASFAGAPAVAEDDDAQEIQALKERHKAESDAMQARHRLRRQSLKGVEMPRAERIRILHEMERERRNLRLKQRDELQELKDRKRILEESQERV